MYKTTIINVNAQDTYEVHQIIAAYFHGQHHLWRKDGETVIVLSDAEPTGELVDGVSLGTSEMPTYTKGQKIPVVMRINPCRHEGENYFPIAPQDVEAWLKDHAKGLHLTFVRSAKANKVVTQKGDHTITLCGYEVGAVAQIEDLEAAMGTLRKGIGRARRFGFGMILPM